MSIRHEQFVESMKHIISKNNAMLKPIYSKEEDESDAGSADLQKELEKLLDEMFGFIDE